MSETNDVPEHVLKHTGKNPISMKALQDLTLVLPRCKVWPPDDANVSYITDKADENVAWIEWNSACITFNADYKHADKLIERFGRERVTIIDRPEEYDISE